MDDFHRHINTIEATIQFTAERESDAQLAFLDVLVIWNPDRTLATSVYRKPTHTDRYLDFQSHHLIAHKLAVIRTLNHRAKNLPSTPTAIAEEERRVAQALKKNGYPRKMIEQQTHHSSPPSQDTTPQKGLCNHPVCEEHLRIHQKNPRTIRRKDILPANQHPTTGPGTP